MNILKKRFTIVKKGVTMVKQVWKGIGHVSIMIKRLLTLRVVFDNILGKQKYKKETKIPKENICVLGISKL